MVFSLTPAGAQTVLYSFGGGADGSHPYKGSLINVKGTLYGITEAGGSGTACTGGCGTVFSVTPAGVETVLYSFQGGSDGVEPTGLIKVGKNFYGTTYGGGTGSFGTVFKLTLTKTGGATETVLHSFQGSDGKFPYGGLINVGGTLYGTTWLGRSRHLRHGVQDNDGRRRDRAALLRRQRRAGPDRRPHQFRRHALRHHVQWWRQRYGNGVQRNTGGRRDIALFLPGVRQRRRARPGGSPRACRQHALRHNQQRRQQHRLWQRMRHSFQDNAGRRRIGGVFLPGPRRRRRKFP
ncbi:MAG: choice-of-anchor tandem repeat GloVer-containing protein [Rhodospirillales bacterium]